MTLPILADVDRRLVVWKNAHLMFAAANGGLDAMAPQMAGTVTITPAARVVTALRASPRVTLTTQADDVVLDAAGVMRAYLVCTDDPDINPSNGWTYSFTLHPAGTTRTFTVTCPVPITAERGPDGLMVPLDLSTMVASVLVPGRIITQGASGVGVLGVAVASNGLTATYTVTYTDGSTSSGTFLLPVAAGAVAVGQVFPFASPAATWTARHTLGRYPYAAQVVVGVDEWTPDISYPDTATAVVTFASPAVGRLTLL